jgi:agmatinase
MAMQLRFCGLKADPACAPVVVFGAPFDGTTSFRPGARFAPARMREDSWGLETYSPYQGEDQEDYDLADAGDLELSPGNAASAIRAVNCFATPLIEAGQVPVMIGGEHSLTLGAFRAALESYPDLHLIHIDAHTDLREDYLGERLSHASVIRRCHDLIGDGRIHSFGVRSGLREEFSFAAKKLDFHPFDLKMFPQVLETLGDLPLYVTIDLDVLDPSVFPGTGTPEPGGISFHDLLTALLALKGKVIVGADIMELSPLLDLSGASTAVACKILRELTLVIAAPGFHV